jgi:hypothetical protein
MSQIGIKEIHRRKLKRYTIPMNNTQRVVLGLCIFIGGFYLFNAYIYNEKQGDQKSARSYDDATFTIDGERVTLVNGVAETEVAPGSVSKVVTKYFGNKVTTDFNEDGGKDEVFIVTREGAGSGTFYYVVAALDTEQGYVGSQALFLGDRIAPQNIEVNADRTISVNYADRAPGESFAVQPSVGKTLKLLLDIGSMQFGEVVDNFEGEADPSFMKIDMKPWVWISAVKSSRNIIPKAPGVFGITFTNTGTFSVTTDCNQASGTYVATRNDLSLKNIVATEKYCEGSQEQEFMSLLSEVIGSHFTSRGEFVLDLAGDVGSITFR